MKYLDEELAKLGFYDYQTFRFLNEDEIIQAITTLYKNHSDSKELIVTYGNPKMISVKYNNEKRTFSNENPGEVNRQAIEWIKEKQLDKEFLLKLTGDEYCLLCEMVNFALCHKDFRNRFRDDPLSFYKLEQMEKLYSYISWGVEKTKNVES